MTNRLVEMDSAHLPRIYHEMPLIYPEMGYFRAYSRLVKVLICRDFPFRSDV
jgi:hypothetical protein